MKENKEKVEYYYNIGFELFGPLFYEFCKWIKENFKKDTQLLFVSREGCFIKKCFNLMYADIKTKMLFVSRKSILSGVASELLKTHSFSDLINKISIKRNETVKDFFYRIGLNFDKYKNNLIELNINEDDLVNVSLDTFYNKYKQNIINDLKANSHLFSSYLENILKKQNLIIDIGWKGTMQNLLMLYLQNIKSTKEIHGLYFGVTDSKNKKGYLFSENNYTCQNVLNYSGILEIIMMPDYGSVIGYKEKDNEIEPVFDESEFTENSLKIIKNLQKGILDFIKEMNLSNNLIEFKKETIIENLNKFAGNPKMKDIRQFEKLEFYENGQTYQLVEPLNLRKLKTNFLNSKWKTAFLKKMLRIKLPYDKIVIFLRKKKDHL